MISISPKSYDLLGGVLFFESAGAVRNGARRLSRSANLDGTVTIVDGGFAHGDRDIAFTVTGPTVDQVERLATIFQDNPLVTVATNDGVYIAAPSEYSANKNDLRVTLLIKETA